MKEKMKIMVVFCSFIMLHVLQLFEVLYIVNSIVVILVILTNDFHLYCRILSIFEISLFSSQTSLSHNIIFEIPVHLNSCMCNMDLCGCGII